MLLSLADDIAKNRQRTGGKLMSNFYYLHVEGEPSSKMDASVLGVYEIEVDADLALEHHASAVLDCFHANMGISILDDFEIFMTDGDGNIVVEEDEHEHMAIEKKAELTAKCATYPDVVRAPQP